MRILHLITRLDRGGSATNTLLTVAGLPSPFGQSLIYGRTVEFPDVPAGVHTVRLEGVAPNCEVDGGDERQAIVPQGNVVELVITVQCRAV